MGEHNIQLGTGEIYFKGPEGWEPFGEVVEMTPIECGDEEAWIVCRKINPIEEVALSFQMCAEAARKMVDAFLGVAGAVLDLCPDKRVVHLAKYGKKARTRKKNRRRAFKILEKETNA